MKKYFYLTVVLFTSFYFSAFAQENEERSLPHFHSIDVGSAIKLELEKGETNKAVIETTNIPLEDVILETEGEVLKIYLNKNSKKNINVVVHLTYTTLKSLDCNSASQVVSKETIEAENFQIEVNSAASANLKLNTKNLTVGVSSAGQLELSGIAEKQNITVDSAGKFNGENLEGSSVTVNASSAGVATVSVSDALKIKANSGGKVKYSGNPSKANVKSSSGGSVKKIK